MIKNNLAVILAERGLKMIDVINATGINKNTITSIANNKASGIQYDTLDKICEFLDITPGELLTRHTLKIDILDFSESESGIHFDIKMRINQDEYETFSTIIFNRDPVGIAFSEEIVRKLSILPQEKMHRQVIDTFYYYLEENEPELFKKLDSMIE